MIERSSLLWVALSMADGHVLYKKQAKQAIGSKPVRSTPLWPQFLPLDSVLSHCLEFPSKIAFFKSEFSPQNLLQKIKKQWLKSIVALVQ